MSHDLAVCRFLNDAPCAYSITYDEGFIHILANALPIHEKFGFPGHVDVVAGQLGKPRDCFRSSMNGLFHMGVDQLKYLISCGWTVGNHSYSHYCWPDQAGLDMYREVVYSRYLLEDQLECAVTFFAIPNDAHNYEPALPYIKEAGYTGCQFIDGGVNDDDVDLLKIGNFMLATGEIKPRPGWPESLLTENIAAKDLEGGWLCETTHLVMHDTIQDWKNVTPDTLMARFEKINEISNRKVWAAVPEDVVDYILMRRSAKIVSCETSGETSSETSEFSVTCDAPIGVRKRTLTFRLSGRCDGVYVGDTEVETTKVNDQQRIFTAEVPNIRGTSEIKITVR